MTIIKTFDTDKTDKSLKGFSKKYVVLVAGLLMSLILVEIWVSNNAVAFGEKYKKLADLEKNLKLENQILENEIAKNSSLSQLASKGAELGFSPATNVQYIR